MQMTNFELIRILNFLNGFAETKLPQKISYAITRNVMTLMTEYSCYEAERNKIFKTYEEFFNKDEEGNVVLSSAGLPIIEGEKSKEYLKEINELLNLEVSVDLRHVSFEAFDYDDTGKYDVLSPKDIMMLQSILCEPEEKE